MRNWREKKQRQSYKQSPLLNNIIGCGKARMCIRGGIDPKAGFVRCKATKDQQEGKETEVK